MSGKPAVKPYWLRCLTAFDDPDDAVGLFWPDVGLSWNPVNVSASDRKLPAFSTGLSMICSALSDPLISPLVRLILGVSPRTVTSADTRGSSLKLTTRVSLRPRVIPSRVTVPKPGSVATSRYDPIGRYGALKKPDSFATSVRDVSVST